MKFVLAALSLFGISTVMLRGGIRKRLRVDDLEHPNEAPSVGSSRRGGGILQRLQLDDTSVASAASSSSKRGGVRQPHVDHLTATWVWLLPQRLRPARGSLCIHGHVEQRRRLRRHGQHVLRHRHEPPKPVRIVRTADELQLPAANAAASLATAAVAASNAAASLATAAVAASIACGSAW